MPINRIAVIKHGSTVRELRAVLGEPNPGDELFFDSYIPYTKELVDGFGDREVLFIGRSSNNERADFGRYRTLTVNSCFGKDVPLLKRVHKRLSADRQIKKAVSGFRPQIIFSFGYYNEQDVYHKLAHQFRAYYVPIVARPWIKPLDPLRLFLWRKGINALKEPKNPAIFVRGEFLREHLVEQFGLSYDKVRLYWPVYPESFYQNVDENPFPKDTFNILWAGRMEENKGVNLLPKIFGKIRKIVPKARLTIVGEGCLKKKLREQLLDVGPEKEVWEIVGFVFSADIAKYYANCDVFISPTFIEGFGKVVYEAQLCGAPVVASRIHNLPYLIEDGKTGILIQPGDIEGFAKAIIRLANDKAFAKDMGRKAAEFARNIKKPSLTKRLKELLDELENYASQP